MFCGSWVFWVFLFLFFSKHYAKSFKGILKKSQFFLAFPNNYLWILCLLCEY
uniref:Uncharacterized protein n=1 Tax=Mus spicilegus TaxID=10103 RepID=A0A8C6I496_MUSSI